MGRSSEDDDVADHLDLGDRKCTRARVFEECTVLEGRDWKGKHKRLPSVQLQEDVSRGSLGLHVVCCETCNTVLLVPATKKFFRYEYLTRLQSSRTIKLGSLNLLPKLAPANDATLLTALGR